MPDRVRSGGSLTLFGCAHNATQVDMSNEHEEKPQSSPRTPGTGQEKQCRICYDSDESDPSLGRLFKPCLCAGTISVSTLGQVARRLHC